MLYRRLTLVAQPGMEGKYVSKDCFKNKKIAVLTSGGDSQGMNSAVRAVVRMGIYCGSVVYLIHEGYQGLVDGGKNIEEATWAHMSGIMQMGGTVIGSARSKDFMTHEGRLKAAKTLIDRDITNLVVLGGDGSLTGANIFRQDWPALLTELVEKKEISEEKSRIHSRLNIVGLVGSIDNDFCGTDMTIGTDTALHRIIEACDSISSTAHSHQRCFILEVMGRHCGYLALVAALASEAEWVFFPEMPPSEDWETRLSEKLKINRDAGQRVNIIILAEGAIDSNCQPITSERIRKFTSDLQIDTRITVLGHVQRGGSPSAFDRILGLRMGAEAVLALIDADINSSSESYVIALKGNEVVRVPLMKCVENTRSVAEAMKNKNFKEAVKLRGRSFNHNLEMYVKLSKLQPPKSLKYEPVEKNRKIAVFNVGAPACGVNAAMRSFVRLSISKGYEVVGVLGGFNGLVNGDFENLSWEKVRGWAGAGGSMLGTRRNIPSETGFKKIAEALKKEHFSGMLLIGGFEAFSSAREFIDKRGEFPEFQIPILVIPATISNNVPGTDFSLGADTSLNEITKIVDKLKQSAVGTKRRVFVIETQGGYCGYLATMSGLAGGADAAYIFEEKFGIEDLRQDVNHMRAKIADNVQRGLILINEKANKNYTTDFVHRLFSEEGKDIFDTRYNIPGHIQQGGVPTPFDRNMGTKIGAYASDWLSEWIEKSINENGVVQTMVEESVSLVGIIKKDTKFSSIASLSTKTDFEYRLPIKQWWLNLRPLLRIMAKHESLYTSEIIMAGLHKE